MNNAGWGTLFAHLLEQITMTTNRQWLIQERPLGRALQASDFKRNDADIPVPGDGELLVKTRYFGFDPAQKGWMENISDYMPPTHIGDVMRGSAIAEVIESRSGKYKAGDLVSGLFGWQDYASVDASTVNKLVDDEYLTANLGVLGTTGMTAYFGLLKLGKPQPGDTVLVSGAAGATGSAVGQIAKIAGCRTIGIAGGNDKCQWLMDELGYDEAIDYKSESVDDRLKELCGGAINVYYDNVGGAILNSALAHIAMNARVVLCGGISRYERGSRPEGPENYFNLVFRRATMEGFIVVDYAQHFPQARARMRQWLQEGKIKHREDVQSGFENIPATLMRLFNGENFGKQMLKND